MSAARDGLVAVLALVLAGPLLWALHFTALYLMHTLLCARAAQGASLVPLGIGLATLLAAAPILLLLFWPRALFRHLGESRFFLRATMQTLLVLSLVAILWGGIAAFFVPACL